MMMPANYSAIAENEMSYVVGGGVVEFLGSFTAPVFTVANLKTLNTNIVTLVGNKYIGKLVDNTLGVVFSGNATWTGIGESLKGLVVTPFGTKENLQIGDGIANLVGLTAAVYNLGNATVANKAASASIGMTKGDGATHIVIDKMPA